MFQNDDWDIDEDYLKDLDEDIIVATCSNVDDNQTNIKRRKIETENSQLSGVLFSGINRNNQSLFEIDNGSQSTQNYLNVCSKKNKVLELFNNNSNGQSTQKYNNDSEGKKEAQNDKDYKTQNNINLSCRRNRVAEILQSNQSTNKVQFKNVGEKGSISPMASQKLTQTRSDSTLNSSIPVSSMPETNTLPKKTMSFLENFQQPKSSIAVLSKDIENNDTMANERRKLVIDYFKKSSESGIGQEVTKRALVRKFPGPAGLLPDEQDELNGQFEDMDSLNTSRNDSINDSYKSKASDLCSQGTTNLFTTGAWQLMLYDLPADFLKGFDIATIRSKVKSNMYKKRKVPYFAGIVQSFDYNSNVPRVVLKDFSGEIEGCMHRNIPNMYPSVLDCGTVVLLRDVGFIKNKTYICVVISSKNIVSMYSNKERVVTTPHIEEILNLQSGIDLDNFDDAFDCHDLTVTDNNESNATQSKEAVESEQKNPEPKVAQIESLDSFEFLDDAFPEQNNGVSVDKSKESQSKGESQKSDNCVLDFGDDEDFFSVVDNASEVNSKFFKEPLSTISKAVSSRNSNVQNVRESSNYQLNTSKSNATQKKIPALSRGTSTSTSSSMTSSASSFANAKNSSSAFNFKGDSIVKSIPSCTNTNSTKMKLLQFKRVEDSLTPAAPSVEPTKDKNTSSVIDLFGNDDTDDELLSQLDMDFFVPEHA